MQKIENKQKETTSGVNVWYVLRHITYFVFVLLILEGAGWFANYIFEYHRTVRNSIELMRRESQPVSASASETLEDGSTQKSVELLIRVENLNKNNAPPPYELGGQIIKHADPDYRQEPLDIEKTGLSKPHRIFVVGGSAAFGFPYRFQNTFSAILQETLNRESYQLFNASRPGWSSGQLIPLVEEIVQKHDPSLLIIFSGNNEWFSWVPKPPGVKLSDESSDTFSWNQTSISILDKLAISRTLAGMEYLLFRWIKSQHRKQRMTTLVDRVQTLGASWNATNGHPSGYQVHHELIGRHYAIQYPSHPMAFDSTQWLQTKKDYLLSFEQNLQRMIKTTQNKNVHVLLLTIPFNYRLSPAWMFPQPEFYNRDFEEQTKVAIRDAALCIEEGRLNQAIHLIDNALEKDPLPAILHYLKAQSLESLGDHRKAEKAYSLCREHMIGHLGSRLSINRIITQTANLMQSELIDVQFLFDQYEHNLGRYYNEDLIQDDCHPSPLGHTIIAKALLPYVLKLSSDPTESQHGQLDRSLCNETLNLSSPDGFLMK